MFSLTIYYTTIPQIIFLDDVILPHTDIYLTVAPSVQEEVYELLEKNDMNPKVIIKDLQK